MAETAANTYATTGVNAAAGAPNQVAVVNDGTGVRQVVVLGAGDGSTTLNDGSLANPVNVAIKPGAAPIKTDNSSLAGADTTTTADGTQLVSLAGPLGDPLDTTGNALNTVSQVIDGNSNSLNIIGTNAPNQNSIPISPASSASIPWAIAAAGNTTSWYVGNYRWVSVHMTAIYTGLTSVTFQGSNDNVNWVSVTLASVAASIIPAITMTTTGLFYGPLNYLYFRLSFAGARTAGTSTGVIAFSTMPGALTTIAPNVVTGQPVAGLKSNNAVVPAATNLGVLPALANANPPLYTETFQTLPSLDLNGQTRITSNKTLNVNQDQLAGNDPTTVADGVGLTAISGPLGDPVDTTGNALNVAVVGGISGTVTMSQNDTLITGTISATDTLAGAPGGAGVLISTVPTANSYVAAAVPGGTSQADIQITGTATGTYYFEASMDSTTGTDGNWIATNYRQTGIVNTVLGYSTVSVGIYRGAPSGFKYIRVRNVGGTNPNNPVTFRYSNGGGTTFLNASLPSGTNNVGNVGASTATGSAVPANAFYKGLQAQTANPTAATAGNLVGALADKLGKQVVVGSIRDLKVQQQTTITSSVAETTVLTAVASTFLDVYGVIVVNSSASACDVTFKDATAGTTRFNIYVPAGDTRGFMLSESAAHSQAVVNNNWTATCGTSVASIKITMLAVKNI